MKIAVTADLHLTTRKEHPERFHALEDILGQMIERKIDTLIIAGDLFHESARNYADFEAVCRDPAHWGIRFIVIPGNHDVDVSDKTLAAENIDVITAPEIRTFGQGQHPVLLVPYAKNRTMGEDIAGFRRDLPDHEWILIGHGDWVEGMREINPLEPGVYMPVTRSDIERFKPRHAVLGHIHKPTQSGNLVYAGSPCPMDITETGKRRYLVLDTEIGHIETPPVDTDVIYFNESLVLIPVEDEVAHIEKLIENMIEGWRIPGEDRSKIRLRLKVSGYTADRTKTRKTVMAVLKEIAFHDGEPDFSGLSVSEDIERAEIARRVKSQIAGLAWPDEDADEPDRAHVLLEALDIIYGDA